MDSVAWKERVTAQETSSAREVGRSLDLGSIQA